MYYALTNLKVDETTIEAGNPVPRDLLTADQEADLLSAGAIGDKPRLDDVEALDDFVAGKDQEIARLRALLEDVNIDPGEDPDSDA